MATFLEGGLAKTIQKMVAAETAKALEQITKDQGPMAAGVPWLRPGGEILEPFDPENNDCNVVKWLQRIEQLGRLHGWSDYEKAYFMQSKLQGAARGWFNSLENYDVSWDEWKVSIAKAFPAQCDFAELLEEMLARCKLTGETMTHYFHDKMAKIQRCGFTGEKAISCLIHGLPRELRGNARAFKCTTPGELYTIFLSSFDRPQRRPETKRRIEEEPTYAAKVARRPPDNQSAGIRCFNCQEVGNHISRNCPKPRAERCMHCGQPGHDRWACPSRTTARAASSRERSSSRGHYQDNRR